MKEILSASRMNTLLACPRRHVDAVFDMLAAQPKPIRFSGGLEAARITPDIAAAVARLRIEILFTAFDRPDQNRAVERAIKRLREATGWTDGTTRHKIGCYCLVGFDGDTPPAAASRLDWIRALGARPFPMFYLGPDAAQHHPPREWSAALRRYLRPSALYAKTKTPPHNLPLEAAR